MPNRAPDFRYIFANTLGFAWSDNDCKLIFGIEEGEGPENALEQVGIVLTHKTAKLLANHMLTIISGYEAHTGQEIPYDTEKADALGKVLAELNPPPASAP